MTNYGSGTDPKIVAVLAYVTLVGWLIAVYLNSNDRSSLGSFHVRQALGIYLLGLASSMVASIPLIGWLGGLVGFVLAFLLWLIGIVSALKEEKNPVPVLGEQFQEWFRSL